MANHEQQFEQESSERAQEHLYKVLVIGDFGVGKTSIIRRYTDDVFSPNYKLTIGVDFSLKTLEWDSRTTINLQLWDIAGHERFGHMTRVYYKYAIAAIIVFDLTRQVTFESVLKWLRDVNHKVMLENGEPVPILLLANKCDAENQQVDTSALETFCSKYNIAGWYITSAKQGTNIEEAMTFLVGRILELSSKEVEAPTDVVDLGAEHRVPGYKASELIKGGTNGYAKISKLNGLTPILDDGCTDHPKEVKKSSSCCEI